MKKQNGKRPILKQLQSKSGDVIIAYFILKNFIPKESNDEELDGFSWITIIERQGVCQKSTKSMKRLRYTAAL